MSSKRERSEGRAERKRRKALRVATKVGHGAEVVTLSLGRDSAQLQDKEDEEDVLSDFSAGCGAGEVQSGPSSPREMVAEQHEALPGKEKDDGVLYKDLVRKLFRENNSEPPLLVQASTNDIESCVFALPGWDKEKKQLDQKRFYVAGFAKVAAGGVNEDPEDEENNSYKLFCNCCETGRAAWHDVELLHDETGACTPSSPCIHTGYVEEVLDLSERFSFSLKYTGYVEEVYSTFNVY